MTNDTLLAGFFQCEPLAKFSIYTQIQVKHLWKLSIEIFELLDHSMSDGAFYVGEENNLNHLYGDFWLWVIGSYEVARTISQYSTCFSETYAAEVLAFKRQIVGLRIPFAKLELQGRSNQPIKNEGSIYSMDIQKKDMYFRVEEKIFSVRSLISEFNHITKNVKLADVLYDLRHAPPTKN